MANIYKALVWSKNLETGNAEIDHQHRQMIETIDQLMDACFQGKGIVEIQSVMSFLRKYTDRHFADEERLQEQCSFPGYQEHKKMHLTFQAEVNRLGRELEAGGPTIEMVGRINKALADWLMNHIRQEDGKIAEFLRTSQQK